MRKYRVEEMAKDTRWFVTFEERNKKARKSL